MELHHNESPLAAPLAPQLRNAASWLAQSPVAKWALSKLNGPLNVMPNERLASTIAGGALVLNAIARPRLFSLFGGLLGGALLSRGLTGHCPVYSALGKKGLTSQGADGVPSQFAALPKPPVTLSQATLHARSRAPETSADVGFGTTTNTSPLAQRPDKKLVEN